MTRKRLFFWTLAFVAALIAGPLLGRGLAWLKVYGEPRRPIIIHVECDCQHEDGSEQRHTTRQAGKSSI